MFNYEFTETQLAMQKLAREFAQKEIEPIAKELDRVQDAKMAFPYEMWKKGHRLGLGTLTMPQKYGGAEADSITELLVNQELAYADRGCAAIFAQLWRVIRIIDRVGTKEQRDKWLPQIRDDDTFVASVAVTEPEAGCDNQLPYEGPEAGLRTTAEPRGDGYIINGTKYHIGFGVAAKLIILLARTDKNVPGMRGVSVFLVPKDTPGVSVGKVESLMGVRTQCNSELAFDNVYVPRKNLLGGVEGIERYSKSGSNLALFATTAGTYLAIARRAYEAALDFAKMRVQGGKRIIQHQAVAIRIADMYIQIEACNSLIWRSLLELEKGEVNYPLCLATKVNCAETIVKVCLEALQMFGGLGYDRDLPMEKYLRDSIAFLHGGGTQDVIRLKIGNLVSGEHVGVSSMYAGNVSSIES